MRARAWQYLFGGALSVFTTRRQGPRRAGQFRQSARQFWLGLEPQPLAVSSAGAERNCLLLGRAACRYHPCVPPAVGTAPARSLLASLGVANKASGEAAAAINWAVKDGAGRLGRFLFARW